MLAFVTVFVPIAIEATYLTQKVAPFLGSKEENRSQKNNAFCGNTLAVFASTCHECRIECDLLYREIEAELKSHLETALPRLDDPTCADQFQTPTDCLLAHPVIVKAVIRDLLPSRVEELRDADTGLPLKGLYGGPVKIFEDLGKVNVLRWVALYTQVLGRMQDAMWLERRERVEYLEAANELGGGMPPAEDYVEEAERYEYFRLQRASTALFHLTSVMVTYFGEGSLIYPPPVMGPYAGYGLGGDGLGQSMTFGENAGKQFLHHVVAHASKLLSKHTEHFPGLNLVLACLPRVLEYHDQVYDRERLGM